MSMSRATLPATVLALFVAAGSLAAQSTTPVGTGCPDSNGRTPVLTTCQMPSIGNSAFAWKVTMVSPAAATYVFLALDTAQTPLSLGGSCQLFLDVPSMTNLIFAGVSPLGPSTASLGAATHPMPIPNLPSLAGVSVVGQGMVIDSAVTLGAVVSNALVLTIN